MQLNHGLHLGYCTNIHRGENWDETFAGLRDYTLEVRKHVCPDDPYGMRRTSINMCTSNAPGDVDPILGTWLMRGLPCRLVSRRAG